MMESKWYPVAVSWAPVPVAYLLGVTEYGLASTALLLTVCVIGEQNRGQREP